MPINDFATATDGRQSSQERVESRFAPSGFMLFSPLDHGAWISKTGIDRKV